MAPAATKISLVVIATFVVVCVSEMTSILLTLSKLVAATAVVPVREIVSIPVPPSTVSAVVRPVLAANASVSSPPPPAMTSVPVPQVMLSALLPPVIVSLAAALLVILKSPSVSAVPLKVRPPVVAVDNVRVAPEATKISLVVIVTAVVVFANVMTSIFETLSKSVDAVKAVLPVSATVSVPAPPESVSLPKPAVMLSLPLPPAIVSLFEPPVIVSLPVPPVILNAPLVSAAPLNVNIPALAALDNVSVAPAATRALTVVMAIAVLTMLGSVIASMLLTLLN